MTPATPSVGSRPPARTFGTLLRHYRAAAGLTQEELAERAGVSVRGIGDMERGVRHTPRNDTIRLLSIALALSSSEEAAFAAAARRLGVVSPPAAVSMGLLPMPIVGRAHELALLERHLAGEGRPVLVLSGEPGIGKSRLLHESVHQAAERGWSVLVGGCQRREGQQPYAPLLGALKRFMQQQAPARLRGQLQGCAWLVRLLPELADGPIEPLPSWALSPGHEWRLMQEAFGRFLANIAGPAGTLLVLDDLQWASADALDLLLSAIRSGAAVPLRVVGAYRSTELLPGSPLSTAMADLAQAGLATSHPLAHLAADDAEELLGRLLKGADAWTLELRERVLRRAAGLPFFLLSWAAGICQGAGASEQDESVPLDVAQSIRQRVAALPEPAQAVLRAATVIGRSVPRTLIVGATTWPEEDVVSALEAACHAGLLLEDGDAAYQFAHDVIREVVEADLSAARRALLHRRIAVVLERDAGERSAELLAYHYGWSDVPDKALAYLELAGDRAMAQYGNATAEKHYRAAIDRLDGLGRLRDSARVREKLGAVLRTLARYDDALVVLEPAAETYRACNDLEDLGRVTALLGRVQADRGTPAEGAANILPAIELLETRGPSRGLAALHTALTHLCYMQGRYAEQLVAAERAARLAEMVKDNGILADARFGHGLGLYAIGRSAEALASMEAVISVGEIAGHYDSFCYALLMAGDIHDERGEFTASKRVAERALRVAERHGDPAMIAIVTTGRGTSAFYAGDWALARRDCESALAMSRTVDAYWGSVYPLLDLGRLSLAEGAWALASQYLEECERMMRPSMDRNAVGEVASVLAERDLLKGHPEAARARLAPLLGPAGLQEKSATYLGLRLAWALLDLGEVQPAADMVARVVTRTRDEHRRLFLVDALRVQARVFLRQDHLEQARSALDEGVALARAIGYPYAEARLLHVYGLLHIQNGEPKPAQERLKKALAIFRRLGARKDIERVEHLIATPA